ncbi:MAG: hypothetical protein OIF57_16835 [Marinobacterium sp.]|nr:hypothetical protein [Marinobacterium sp.]
MANEPEHETKEQLQYRIMRTAAKKSLNLISALIVEQETGRQIDKEDIEGIPIDIAKELTTAIEEAHSLDN